MYSTVYITSDCDLFCFLYPTQQQRVEQEELGLGQL